MNKTRSSDVAMIRRARYCAAPTVRSVAGVRPSTGRIVLEAYRPGASEVGVDARHRDVVVL